MTEKENLERRHNSDSLQAHHSQCLVYDKKLLHMQSSRIKRPIIMKKKTFGRYIPWENPDIRMSRQKL